MGRELIVYADGRKVGPYEPGEAQLLLDRYTELFGPQDAAVETLIDPDEVGLTAVALLYSH